MRKHFTKFNSKIAFTSLALTAGLIANEPIDMNYKLPIKGEAWQLFGFNQEIDLEASFNGTSTHIIWAWDNHKQNWTAYSPQYATMKALEDANHTLIDRLQPNQGFWIMSYEDIEVDLKEVFYPLYDMCVDVNSDKHWTNSVDENNVALTQPFYQCENYISKLPKLEVFDRELELFDGNSSVKGSYQTNLPVVFVKNLIENRMVPINDITDLDQYFDANGSIYNITFNYGNTLYYENNILSNSLITFSFELGNVMTSENYNSVVMFIGNSDKVEEAIEIEIPIQDVFVDYGEDATDTTSDNGETNTTDTDTTD